MEYETSRILEISLAKIDRRNASRKQATVNSTLHRNLLVSSVLKAIKPDVLPGKDILMDYRETKIIDLDIDEANFEKEASFVKTVSNRKTHLVGTIHSEWKPRGNSESLDLEMKDNLDCETKENSERTDDCRQDINQNQQNYYDMDFPVYETYNTTSSFLRNSLSFKRPRDSDFDMSHMPRPHKICRVVNNDSGDADTQAVSCLESLFRDSFNDFQDQTSYDRQLNFASFPLVSVMAC